MRVLVIGLGNFGRTLAERLTDNGHEVIGVDSNEHRVDEIKERISMAYILDAMERTAMAAIPLDEVDCAVVCIGQSMDNSLRAVSALKALKVRSIYARAIDEVHRSILAAMNIDRIFIPECYAARIFADRLSDDGGEEPM